MVNPLNIEIEPNVEILMQKKSKASNKETSTFLKATL